MSVDALRKARDAQAAEWSTFVALGPIDHEGVRAYNEGDPVPVSNVARYGYDKDGLVGKVPTSSAAAGTDKKDV